MIEKTIQDYLSDALPVPVWPEMPEDPPETFVLFERTGRSMTDRIYTAVFAVQSYAPTQYEASVLNEAVIGAMLQLPVLNEIGGVSLVSDYPFNDPDKHAYRYQAVFNLTHY